MVASEWNQPALLLKTFGNETKDVEYKMPIPKTSFFAGGHPGVCAIRILVFERNLAFGMKYMACHPLQDENEEEDTTKTVVGKNSNVIFV